MPALQDNDHDDDHVHVADAERVVDAEREPSHTQVWFGPEERPLFGWLSVPGGTLARGAALLCAPMGEEGRSAHRTFRTLAESLAQVGIMALRFDYDGTGDSAGAQDDPDRVEAWLDSIESGRQYLLSRGAPSVAAVGMRLGATLLARHVAETGTGYHSLVLWDPCPSGRTFLREGEALHAFGEGAEAGGTPNDGLRHTPGFQYDAATATSLRGLDLGRVPASVPLADRVLLLTREDRPVAPQVLARLAREGERLESRPAHDQDLLLDLPPSDNVVPRRALRDVVGWLEHGVVGLSPVPVTPPPAAHPVTVGSRGAGAGSVPVVERSVSIGPAGLFGMVTEPPDSPDGPALVGPRPWVVLVNVAVEHHIGPGRRWVDFARRWAAMGYRCVRIDQSGLGDSPRHRGQREGVTFAPEWLDDMSQVVRHFGDDGSPVILIGLCSGAYSSFEAAMSETVDSVFAVNPRLTIYSAAKGTAVYTPRRRAAMIPAAPVAALAKRNRIIGGAIWRIYRQVAVWHAPYAVLRKVVRRGTQVEVISCAHDAKHFTEVAFWLPSLARLRRRGELRFERVVLDHSLLGRGSQELAYDRATAFLERRHRAVAR